VDNYSVAAGNWDCLTVILLNREIRDIAEVNKNGYLENGGLAAGQNKYTIVS
jgi:hypothetical protein